MIDLPRDGIITRSTFDGLPKPAEGWTWELRDGRLKFAHTLVTVWHWQIIMLVLGYWQRLGHMVAGE